METKGVTCKIPLDLHNKVSEEIRETESTMSKFIEMVITEHYEKGANRIMEKGRTLAFQVSEELFQRVKEYLENYEKTYHRRLTQKEFVIGSSNRRWKKRRKNSKRPEQPSRRNRKRPAGNPRKASRRTRRKKHPPAKKPAPGARKTAKQRTKRTRNPMKTPPVSLPPGPGRKMRTVRTNPMKAKTSPAMTKKPTHKGTSTSPAGLGFRPSPLRGCFHIYFNLTERGDVH